MLIASKVVSDVAVVRGLSRAVYASAGWTRGRAGSAQGSGYFECVAALRRADRGVEALCALFRGCRADVPW